MEFVKEGYEDYLNLPEELRNNSSESNMYLRKIMTTALQKANEIEEKQFSQSFKSHFTSSPYLLKTLWDRLGFDKPFGGFSKYIEKVKNEGGEEVTVESKTLFSP